MTTISQRDSVVEATEKVLKERGISRLGDQRISDVADKEVRAAVVDLVIADFESGRTTMRPTDANKVKLADKRLLRKYVSGLVADRWTKDPSLNGGNNAKKRKIKDAQMLELHKLKELCLCQDNVEAIELVNLYIEARQEELETEALPAELKHLRR